MRKQAQPETKAPPSSNPLKSFKVVAFKVDRALLTRLEDSARIADRTVSAEIRVLLRKAYGLEVEDARAAI